MKIFSGSNSVIVHSDPNQRMDVSVIFFTLALQPISGLGRLNGTFLFTSVTRSRTVGRTPWTCDKLVARPLRVHKHRETDTLTNIKHPCPEWNSNSRSRRPRE
jgi:hypothetical protein